MSVTEALLLVALICALLALGVLLLRRRNEGRLGDKEVRISDGFDLTPSLDAATQSTAQALALPSGSRPVFEVELAGAEMVPGQPLIIEDPLDANQVILLGSPADAAHLGEVIGAIPGQMAGMIVGADAMVKAGIAMGEQSGVLVRVYADSAKALREGKKVYDSAGRTLAVVQNANGKITHVLRIAPATGLQTATAGLGALSAIAMQAQLASMERKLQEVIDGVRGLQVAMNRHEQAQLDGMDRTLNDIYQGARTSGVLSQAAWDQLAPLRRSIDEHHANAELKAKDFIDDLSTRKSTKDRRSWFAKRGREFEKAMAQLVQAERALIQFEALRAWWLALTDDAAAGHYAAQLRDRLEARRLERNEIEESAARALDGAGTTRFWDYVHSPWDSSKVGPLAVELLSRLNQSRLLGVEPVAKGEPDP